MSLDADLNAPTRTRKASALRGSLAVQLNSMEQARMAVKEIRATASDIRWSMRALFAEEATLRSRLDEITAAVMPEHSTEDKNSTSGQSGSKRASLLSRRSSLVAPEAMRRFAVRGSNFGEMMQLQESLWQKHLLTNEISDDEESSARSVGSSEYSEWDQALEEKDGEHAGTEAELGLSIQGHGQSEHGHGSGQKDATRTRHTPGQTPGQTPDPTMTREQKGLRLGHVEMKQNAKNSEGVFTGSVEPAASWHVEAAQLQAVRTTSQVGQTKGQTPPALPLMIRPPSEPRPPSVSRPVSSSMMRPPSEPRPVSSSRHVLPSAIGSSSAVRAALAPLLKPAGNSSEAPVTPSLDSMVKVATAIPSQIVGQSSLTHYSTKIVARGSLSSEAEEEIHRDTSFHAAQSVLENSYSQADLTQADGEAMPQLQAQSQAQPQAQPQEAFLKPQSPPPPEKIKVTLNKSWGKVTRPQQSGLQSPTLEPAVDSEALDQVVDKAIAPIAPIALWTSRETSRTESRKSNLDSDMLTGFDAGSGLEEELLLADLKAELRIAEAERAQWKLQCRVLRGLEPKISRGPAHDSFLRSEQFRDTEVSQLRTRVARLEAHIKRTQAARRRQRYRQESSEMMPSKLGGSRANVSQLSRTIPSMPSLVSKSRSVLAGSSTNSTSSYNRSKARSRIFGERIDAILDEDSALARISLLHQRDPEYRPSGGLSARTRLRNGLKLHLWGWDPKDHCLQAKNKAAASFLVPDLPPLEAEAEKVREQLAAELLNDWELPDSDEEDFARGVLMEPPMEGSFETFSQSNGGFHMGSSIDGIIDENSVHDWDFMSQEAEFGTLGPVPPSHFNQGPPTGDDFGFPSYIDQPADGYFAPPPGYMDFPPGPGPGPGPGYADYQPFDQPGYIEQQQAPGPGPGFANQIPPQYMNYAQPGLDYIGQSMPGSGFIPYAPFGPCGDSGPGPGPCQGHHYNPHSGFPPGPGIIGDAPPGQNFGFFNQAPSPQFSSGCAIPDGSGGCCVGGCCCGGGGCCGGGCCGGGGCCAGAPIGN
eukprot:TRINITY_DN7567_c3_g2_i1.p1 TRINITY_DN7567_c3_g2~~TRINITY_DN7567_c3_g2_i1.p1  ORF type:complete len:1207 (+),score=241.16 TRINITY_DN7567_c3_g2_i1:504-3623(+)